MIRGKELEEQVYDPEHIRQVQAEIERNFPDYFESFAQRPIMQSFHNRIKGHREEQKKYEACLDLEAMDEYEYDPDAFKAFAKQKCPVIHNALMAQAEAMQKYQSDFNKASGRELLDTMRHIAEFGRDYVAAFDDEAHEEAATYADLGLGRLNEPELSLTGVVGYGIQSSLLYSLYPGQFASRLQSALWSLFFLSGRETFGLEDGSEFQIWHLDEGTCAHNYFYPADLFGFYCLYVFLLLRSACEEIGIDLENQYRYIYLSEFFHFIADKHREDINVLTNSSETVESRWY